MPANPPPNSQTQLAKRTTHNALPTHLLLYTTNNNDSSIKPKRFPMLTSLWAGTTVAVRWSKPLPPGGMLHARAAGTVDLPNAGPADCHLPSIQLATLSTHSTCRTIRTYKRPPTRFANAHMPTDSPPYAHTNSPTTGYLHGTSHSPAPVHTQHLYLSLVKLMRCRAVYM